MILNQIGLLGRLDEIKYVAETWIIFLKFYAAYCKQKKNHPTNCVN